jgi:hypothetical protein
MFYSVGNLTSTEMECNKFNKYMKIGQKLMLLFNPAYCLPNDSKMKQIQKGH